MDFEKNMLDLREADSVRTQRDAGRGALRDVTMQHKVEIRWDLNPEAVKEKMFKLVIDDNIEVILDSEQMLRYLRWV